MKEDGLGATVGAVGRLQRMKEVVISQLVVEVLKDNFLKKLGNERKVSDRAILFRSFGARLFFFRRGRTKATATTTTTTTTTTAAAAMLVLLLPLYCYCNNMTTAVTTILSLLLPLLLLFLLLLLLLLPLL